MGMASAKPKLAEKRRREEDWLRQNRSLLRNEAGKRIGFGETEACRETKEGRRIGFGKTEA